MLNKILVLIGAFIVSVSAYASPVNVNTASPDEIASALKGIGPAKAAAISTYCKEMSCSKPEDLLAVKGIGEKTLEKIKSDLRFEK
ncbi:helix-hairpin-helix domain-containing protein [Thiomicrorhabdus sp. zzn3]|uniref:ComEA family DNA-binding protein n=1 Tax=Thiomicrorhabdus sp. zzn3 TaxID=3039775 RepID=UPI0024368918|nr:helix-hairpin-helix domain-containing protein [Thiomicrorhabdus sp. zzn3]MDG6777391.1 helix-hairpin-helix domain-containing protein [Thiomicrorhabdus sp. zzn3]